jgi:hypothetical protein
MTQDNKKKPGEEQTQEPMPSTGEGSDSALDVLRRKRRQTPPADATLPLTPPPKK